MAVNLLAQVFHRNFPAFKLMRSFIVRFPNTILCTDSQALIVVWPFKSPDCLESKDLGISRLHFN